MGVARYVVRLTSLCADKSEAGDDKGTEQGGSYRAHRDKVDVLEL